MSSSIAIPKRRKKLGLRSHAEQEQPHSPAASSSFASSLSSASYTSSSGAAGKRRASDTAANAPRTEPDAAPQAVRESSGRERRFSLLSSSLEEAEHTVINVGGPDTPRLITCVRSSQGFDWNQDLFLPSYIDHDSHDLEHKQDPVDEIILTEEEQANMLPS